MGAGAREISQASRARSRERREAQERARRLTRLALPRSGSWELEDLNLELEDGVTVEDLLRYGEQERMEKEDRRSTGVERMGGAGASGAGGGRCA